MDAEVVGLARYAGALRRRAWLVAAFALVFAVAAFGYTATQPATYKATAQVLIRPYSSASFNEPVFTSEQVATQVQVMQSLSVAAPVVAQLGLDESPTALLKTITAAPVGDTSVISVTVSRTSPELAAQIANAIGNSYLAFRASGQPAGANNDSPGNIISEAQPPLHKAGRSPVLGGVLGGVVGLILGCIAAIVLAARDRSITDESELARATGGLAVLGRIPKGKSGPRGIALLDSPQSAESLAYRFLATTLRVLDKGRHKAARGDVLPTVVLVASAASGDGRTSVAANLALASAAGGQRVLVCDGDVLQPRLTALFGLTDEVTFDAVLAGQLSIVPDRLARPATGLRAIGTRRAGGDHALPLATGQFARMIRSLADVVDLVIVDSAPLLRSTEALELVADADLVLLTVREGASTSTDVEAVLERIGQVGGAVSGVVITRSAQAARG